MTSRLLHRGPDAEGVFLEGPAALGHRRLAVIDTRPSANQPMLDTSGRFVVVFNGELYNYLDLRAELEGKGARFVTDSDTEVLLESYKTWGPTCLSRFNGMFAFAVWDRREQRLFLARDRLGEKPLLYRWSHEGIVFASELKALRASTGAPRDLNPRALSHFLSLNYILASECIVAGIAKLAPAHYLVVERDKPPQVVRYWNLADRFRTKQRFRSDEDAGDALGTLLDDAVRLRLVSDVPLGAFLSGGLDSSAIVASMCRLLDPGRTHTFSIGFSEPGYSELAWARRVARALNVDHREATVSPDIASEIERMVHDADEPFADTSFMPTYFLGRFARQFVTVCLSGDGGDELFAGYDTYVADRLHRACTHVPGPFIAAARLFSERVLPVTRRKISLDYKIRQFLKGAARPPLEAHYSWRTIFSNEEGRCVLSPDLGAGVQPDGAYHDFAGWAREVDDCHYLDQAMYVDIKTWLADDILVKLDRATMAHSLEARAPFLDYRLVEFAAGLPVDLKLRGLRKKYALKLSQRRRLPASVIARSKKGFNAPVSHWIGTSLRGYLDEILTNQKTKGFFNHQDIHRLRDEHDRGRADNGLKLFGILCLGLWLKQL